jgi:hypothetical protein
VIAPTAQASAATPPAAPPAAVATVTGPTLTGDVFNGATEIVTTRATTAPTLAGERR